MQWTLIRTDAMKGGNWSNDAHKHGVSTLGSNTFFTFWRLKKAVWLSDLEIDTMTNNHSTWDVRGFTYKLAFIRIWILDNASHRTALFSFSKTKVTDRCGATVGTSTEPILKSLFVLIKLLMFFLKSHWLLVHRKSRLHNWPDTFPDNTHYVEKT